METTNRGASHRHAAWSALGDVLVQPYMASVDDYGERSLVWIDGELTHAIRKSPRFSGQDEAVTGPWPITADERALAAAALAPWRASILYARVDLVRDAFGAPRVMELELIEPSLFFAQHPPAVERYAMALWRTLRRCWLGTVMQTGEGLWRRESRRLANGRGELVGTPLALLPRELHRATGA